MRLGIYLGRHFGGGGGIALYGRSLLRNYLKLLELSENDGFVLYLYGESTILTDDVKALIDDVNARCPRVVVKPLSAKAGRKLGILWDQLVLCYRSLRDRLDLLHAIPNFGPVLSFCPRVVTVHDLFQAYPPSGTAPSFTNLFYRALFRLQLPFVRQIVLDSTSVGEEVAERYKVTPERRTVIPLGIDDDVFSFVEQANEPAVRATLERLGLQPGYLLVLGASDPRKNFRAALRAVRLAEPSAAVVLKLSDKGAAALIAEENSPGVPVTTIEWVERSELLALYLGAEAVLFPSLAEGFGYPALEALALGAALVAPELDCLRGVPRERFHPCNPLADESIAEALKDALSNRPPEPLTDRISRVASQLSSFHSMRRAASETLTLYREVLLLAEGRS